MDFPKAFELRVQQDSFLGEALLKALNEVPPTSIRLNPRKGTHLFPEAQVIPWSDNGRWLNKRPVFTLDPVFHGGAYYPQEAGSQFLATALKKLELPDNPVILDLCAAPGGKSTLILDYLNGNGLLVANEIIPNRARILKENLNKWGAKNALVTNNEPADFEKLGSVFDCMVVDAPCSGEGMFRKDLQAREEWSEENVAMCAGRQRVILETIWDNLKPGGYLIYSTCTFNSSENEENVRWLCDEFDAELVSLSLEKALPGRENIGHYAIPGKLDTEGYYFAAVRKNGMEQNHKPSRSKSDLSVVKTPEVWSPYADLTNGTVVQWSKYHFLIPSTHLELIQRIHAALRIQKLGTELGELGPKGPIPDMALALDPESLNPSVTGYELELEQALKYLKGETFSLDGSKGFARVLYQGVTLGWINHLGNRFNNLYPKEWRIRMRID